MKRKVTGNRTNASFATWLAIGGFALALLAYGVGAWESPMLDAERRMQMEVQRRYAETGRLDEQRERSLADAYWTRYPDVARDPYFGREGVLGLWGAREHYAQHGKREGRSWKDLR
jgi:hypothetical protein